MASVLQTDQWAAFKEKYGWQSRRVSSVLILSRRLLAGKSMWYAPEVKSLGPPELNSFMATVSEQAKADRAFVFRPEFAIPFSDDFAARLKELKLRKSFECVQPEWRALVDIRPKSEQILLSMHQKGRYNIRVAERHGVLAEQSQELDSFYSLYSQTAKRDGFTVRSKEYLQDLLAMIPGAALFLARQDKKVLAGAIIIFFGDSASYLYGASSSEDRQLMAPYLLHWEVIQEAKRRGCLSYDLGEIPPQSAADHPLQGLGKFKMKLGASATHSMGSWDYVISPFWYRIFRVGQKLRRGFRA